MKLINVKMTPFITKQLVYPKYNFNCCEIRIIYELLKLFANLSMHLFSICEIFDSKLVQVVSI